MKFESRENFWGFGSIDPIIRRIILQLCTTFLVGAHDLILKVLHPELKKITTFMVIIHVYH